MKILQVWNKKLWQGWDLYFLFNIMNFNTSCKKLREKGCTMCDCISSVNGAPSQLSVFFKWFTLL